MSVMLHLDKSDKRALRKAFQTLPLEFRPGVLHSTFKRQGKPMKDEAKRRVPVGEGDTKKSIRFLKVKRKDFTGIRLTGGYKLNFLENGTVPRKRKNGGNTGSGPSYRILSGAFERTKDEVLKGFKDSAKKAVIAKMKRTVNKASRI